MGVPLLPVSGSGKSRSGEVSGRVSVSRKPAPRRKARSPSRKRSRSGKRPSETGMEETRSGMWS